MMGVPFISKTWLMAFVCLALAAVGAQAALALGTSAESTLANQFRYPATINDNTQAAELVRRVARALSVFAYSCARRDEKTMAGVFTSSAVVAYASDTPGIFIATDAFTADRCWASVALSDAYGGKSPIWIYPTGDPSVVFIQYTVVLGTGAARREVEDLALIEMTGDRISQIRDYMASAGAEP
jgi:hypothetical protein